MRAKGHKESRVTSPAFSVSPIPFLLVPRRDPTLTGSTRLERAPWLTDYAAGSTTRASRDSIIYEASCQIGPCNIILL